MHIACRVFDSCMMVSNFVQVTVMRHSDSSAAAGEACSHCSAVMEVLSAEQTNADTSLPVEWTPHFLQRIVHLGGLKVGSSLLSDLSSMAMYNLLVLLELNIKILPQDALVEFIKNIERLPFVSTDEWCVFLIGHLRRQIESTGFHPLVVLEKESVPISEDVKVEELLGSPLVEENDVKMEVSSCDAVVGSSNGSGDAVVNTVVGSSIAVAGSGGGRELSVSPPGQCWTLAKLYTIMHVAIG